MTIAGLKLSISRSGHGRKEAIFLHAQRLSDGQVLWESPIRLAEFYSGELPSSAAITEDADESVVVEFPDQARVWVALGDGKILRRDPIDFESRKELVSFLDLVERLGRLKTFDRGELRRLLNCQFTKKGKKSGGHEARPAMNAMEGVELYEGLLTLHLSDHFRPPLTAIQQRFGKGDARHAASCGGDRIVLEQTIGRRQAVWDIDTERLEAIRLCLG